MSEMIHRVAVALLRARGIQCTDDCELDEKEIYIARAAIEAMREPTQDMLDAGGNQVKGIFPDPENAGWVWYFMIDKALG